MSDVSWSGLDVFDASQSPQPYSGGLNIDMPDPNQDIQQLSSAVGRGSVSFNGLDAPPPINIDVDEYLRTPGIQDVINSAENPTDMRQRVENALTIANMLDIPPAQAMEQLGVFSESLFGTQDQRTVAEQLRRAVRLGVEQTRYSMLGMRALLNNDEELEQELRSFEFTDPGDDNTFLRKAVIGVGTQIPRYTAALATGAGAAGAAGLAAAPFGAAKPAALWTFPKAVMTANMMMETGFMYGQLLSMEGEQGERVSRGAARVGSLAYGAAAGFLETMGQRLIAMPGGTRFVQALSQNLGSNFSAFVARTAARFGTAAIGEGATEFTQELASGFTQNIVAAVENAKANRIYNSQDFVFDQIARGELDQDTATNMLNNPRMLSSYIEEQGGREALGIGQRPGDGVFLLKDQQEIFSEASSAFVTAMITGGVFGTVPAIAGAGRDGRLHQAMRREIDAIIQEKIEANPEVDLETLINETMNDERVQAQSQRFIRAASQAAMQRETDPEVIHDQYLEMKQQRPEWRRQNAEDAVSRRFQEAYREEVRPDTEEVYRRLREAQEEDTTLSAPPEEEMLREFIKVLSEEQEPAAAADINEQNFASYVQSPEIQESLKSYWIERHAKETRMSENEYREVFRQRTNTMAATIDELARASRFVASEVQQRQLADLSLKMQEELNRVKRDMSLPSSSMETYRQFNAEIQELQAQVQQIESELSENQNSAEKRDELARVKAQLKVAQIRSKDAAQIATRVMENVERGYTMMDEQVRALAEVGVTSDEAVEALEMLQNSTLEEIEEAQRTPEGAKSSLTRKVNSYLNSTAKHILKTKTRHMHTPYAKAIEYMKKQITRKRGSDKANGALRQVLTQEIGRTGRLDQLYANSQITEILKKPINKWTPMEMLRARNMVDVLAEVGKREARIAQEEMQIRAEETRTRIAENIGRIDEYVKEVDEQIIAKAPKNAINVGPKRVEIKLDDDTIERLNNYTTLEIDKESLINQKDEYNSTASVFYAARGALQESDFDYDGYKALWEREQLLRTQTSANPTDAKTRAEYSTVFDEVSRIGKEIAALTGTVDGEQMIAAERFLKQQREAFKQWNTEYQQSIDAYRGTAENLNQPDQAQKKKFAVLGDFLFPHVIVDLINGKRARYKGTVHETLITAPLNAEAQAKGDVKFRLKETLDVMAEQNIRWNDLTNDLIEGVQIQEAMYYYLANKNDAFAALVRAEQRLSEQQWTSIIEALDDTYKTLAETMHRHLKESYEEIRDVSMRIYGRDMGFIDEWLPLFRNMVDADDVQTVNIFETVELGKSLDDRITLSRAKSVSGRGIRTDFASLYFNMLPKQRRFIHLAEPLAVMKKSVINDDALKKQLTEKLGGGYVDALQKLYDRYAQPNVTAADSPIDRLFRRLTRNLVATRLFLNASTMLKQGPSALNYMREVGITPMTRELADTVINFKKKREAIFDLDPYIANRVMQIGAEEINAINNSFGGTVVQKVQEFGLSPVRGVDQLMVLSGWNAAYKKAIAKGMSKEEAIVFARELTIRTQPDANPTTLPQMYSNGAFIRFFLAFSQQPYKNLSQLMYDMPSSVRRVWEDTQSEGRVAQAAAAAAEASKWSSALIAQAALITAMTGFVGMARGYDEDAEWTETFLPDSLMNIIGWLPVAGSAISSAYYGFEPSQMPFQAASESIFLLGKDIVDGEFNFRTIRSLTDAFAMATGLPANRIEAVIRYMTR